MRFLFVHQNCPGQYVHYVRHLLARNGHEVFFLTAPNSNEIPGLRRVNYLPQAASTPGIHPDAVDFESSMIRARSAHDRALQLAGMGMQPDVIIGHNGWGEMLHIRHGFGHGRVQTISEDAFRQDPDTRAPLQMPFFRSRISIDELAMRNLPNEFRLVPGMPVTADIIVGQRTMLGYLFQRIMPTLQEGMREP